MNDLRQRTRGKILQNAIFSPLSALIIATGIILVGVRVPIPVLGGPPLYLSPVWWLAAVVPAWLGVVGVNLTSRQAGELAVSQALREQFDVDRISNPSLRMNVAQSIAYRERIDKAVTRFSDSAMQGRMQDVANQAEEWVRNIYTLATRLDEYRNDSIIRNDLASVPEALKKLKQRLSNETDDGIKHELGNTIDRRQTQYNNLLKLDNTMERAELQLENTLTALGTVYSQMMLVDARDVDSSKAQRLRDNIAEQVNSLQDVITSMNEVYSDQPGRSPANIAATS